MAYSPVTLLRSSLATLVFCGAVAAPSLHAQDLPAASELVDRYRQAVGGADLLASRRSIHSTGEFSMPAAGVSGEFESLRAQPNLVMTRIVIPGLGEMRTGYTGEIGWSMNPMEGPRLMQDGEARQAADEASFESSLRLPSRIDSMATVEMTRLGGTECIKVRIAWKSGRESFDCYSPETGLLVGTMTRQETHMGVIDAVTLYDDYRDFHGLKMPARITVQAMGVEQVITVSDVRFDTLDGSAFEPPAEIKALIGG
jgi:hypothetical protein